QVPLAISSLNHGDSFVLDLGSLIYVWMGIESSRMEKIKAVDAARNIRDDERAGKAKIEIIEDTPEGEDAEFLKFLGGKDSGEIGPSTPDETFVRAAAAAVTLYHISDASGSLEMK
ncbi:hypothetical protein, partial [Salmonella sp. s51228]|uniref:hypothetical protein n=1 Tax=Salmonella sp. s51228 TaxID=3159652 RepID=UPI0039819009